MSFDESVNTSGTEIHGIDVFSLRRGGVTEIYATVLPNPDEDIPSMLARAGSVVRDYGSEIIRMFVFGSTDAYPSFTQAAVAELGDAVWPTTFVDGEACEGGAIAGIQLHAVVGGHVETVRLNDRPVGRVYQDDYASYCYLGDLTSTDSSLPREIQGRESFDSIESGLNAAGMDLKDLVRTWLFIDDILEWYGEFNRMRDQFFNEKGMFDRFLPASTGIGGANHRGTAVTACAVAMHPKGDDVTVQEVLSPLQCPAFDYGSSFCRAAEITTPEYRSVLVSGTASIAPEGETVHLGDKDAQIDLTLRVVQEILKTCGLGFGNTTRANAYFKHRADASGFESSLDKYGLPAKRVVVSHDDVCRDNLLFEIELDAIVANR